MPSASPSFTPTPTGNPVSSRGVSLPSGAQVALRSTATLPLRIDAGIGIARFDLDIGFDPNVVEFVQARLASAVGQGTLAAHIATPGYLVLDGDLRSAVTDDGPLIDLVFRAVGACRSSSELVITSCALDGGAVGCRPRDGRISVRCGAGGQIRNVNAAPVSDTMVAMYSDVGPPDVSLTDGFGDGRGPRCPLAARRRLAGPDHRARSARPRGAAGAHRLRPDRSHAHSATLRQQ